MKYTEHCTYDYSTHNSCVRKLAEPMVILSIEHALIEQRRRLG